MSASIKAGMKSHFQQIMKYGGKDVIHRIITQIIDEMGNIINQSYTDTTITGIISTASYQGNYYPIGSIQTGDLTAYFWYSDDVIKSKQISETEIRYDHIIYENIEYRVEQLAEIAYDVKTPSVNWEPIFCRYQLRKIAKED